MGYPIRPEFLCALKTWFQSILNYVNDDKVGMLCPRIYDINCGYVDVISNEDATTEVKDCLASASAIRIQCLEKYWWLF